MRIEKIYFKSEDGLELTGLLHTSEGREDKEVVISTHGMGSNCLKKRDDIIARKVSENGISYFTYNNRGHGLINPVSTEDGKIIQGTVFEDVENSYFDIVGAIKCMLNLGYKKIYLQGHSLGSTKTVYTYNKLIQEKEEEILNSIKAVILLSLVDLVDVMQLLVKSNPTVDVPKLALEKEKLHMEDFIIETKVPFMPYVSVKTFLKYYRDNSNFDFARYTDNKFDFTELNNIKVPIFMRWGNKRELVSISAEDVAKIVNSKLKSQQKDISVIDGATHNYKDKESILAEEIMKFLKLYRDA